MSKTMQMNDRFFGFIMQICSILFLITLSQQSIAKEELPVIDDQYVQVEIIDPKRDAGYVVGDILNRKVTLTVKKPYELVTESLPIVGYEHRYRGKKSGIELVSVKQTVDQHTDSETYTLDLGYQVFKTDRTVKPAALRAEILKFRHLKNQSITQYRLPDFTFRVSPLSLIGQIKLDEEMYPFIKPLTLDTGKTIINIKLLATLLGLSLLGLLYIFGKHAWLPRMGAPFAKAYRDVKKLSDSPDDLKQAISRIHTSLNKTAGESLFSQNLPGFIQKNTAFSPVKHEIEQFFGLSHQVFFEDASQSLNSDNPKAWLLQFCRRLRDCERGLTPDPIQGSN